MPKHGKQYLAAIAQVEEDKMYEPGEAVGLVKKTSFVKFDPTIEVHMKLGIDPRHADQQVRATANLPHGTGNSARVLGRAGGEGERIALGPGADYAGSDELIKRINDGWVDFDIAIAI